MAGKQGGIERRAYVIQELRVDPAVGDEPVRIRGYASVFDSESLPLMEMPGMQFKEKVERGAFADTIQNDDVRALMNHDPNYVLGRNRAGTLRLAEDAHGLGVDIIPPDTQWARDLAVSMKRGDVTQMSFAFKTLRDGWEQITDPDTGAVTSLRTLKQVRLFDVSVVTFPAYPSTNADVRALAAAMNVYYPEPPQAERSGDELQAERDLIECELELLALQASN